MVGKQLEWMPEGATLQASLANKCNWRRGEKRRAARGAIFKEGNRVINITENSGSTGYPDWPPLYPALLIPVPHTVLLSPLLLCCHCRFLNHGRPFSRGTVPFPRAAPQERNRRHVFPYQVPRIWRPWSAYRYPRHRRGSRGPRHAGKADWLPHGSQGLLPWEANASTGRAHSNQWAHTAAKRKQPAGLLAC